MHVMSTLKAVKSYCVDQRVEHLCNSSPKKITWGI